MKLKGFIQISLAFTVIKGAIIKILSRYMEKSVQEERSHDIRSRTAQAIILAGGRGTRLRSIVDDRPKPMVEIGGKPFLELLVERIKRYGINDFIFCVGYLHEYIQDYFQDGHQWGVNIDYSVEEMLLGTGGALKLAEPYVRDTFLVFNGDSYLDVDLDSLIKFHDEKRKFGQIYLGTIVLTEMSDTREFGSIQIDANNRVLRFHEKAPDKKVSNIISAGIYIFQREFLQRIPTGKTVSLESEVFPELIESDGHIYGYQASSFFVDIGTPVGYAQFQDYVKEEAP